MGCSEAPVFVRGWVVEVSGEEVAVRFLSLAELAWLISDATCRNKIKEQ